MTLIRFDSTSDRGPSAALWKDLVDWVKGSLSTDLGNRDFDDFAPYNSGNEVVAGTAGAAASLVNSRDGVVGVVNLTATAGANAEAGAVRNVVTQLNKVNMAVFEARLVRNDSADAQFTAIGLTDQAGGGILASNALATGGSEDFIGYRWNEDGTIDLVAIVAGTLTELVDTVATIVNGSATGYSKIGLRIEKITSTSYRLMPSINGVALRAKAKNVANTALPETVTLKPAVAIGTDATTAPSLDRDWFMFADK